MTYRLNSFNDSLSAAGGGGGHGYGSLVLETNGRRTGIIGDLVRALGKVGTALESQITDFKSQTLFFHDLRAYAAAGVHFEHQRVPHAAVDDVNLPHASLQRLQARFAPWESCRNRSAPEAIISRAWLAVSEWISEFGIVLVLAARRGRRSGTRAFPLPWPGPPPWPPCRR